MSRKQTSDKYSEDEAQRRMEAALRGAFKTPPMPMKSMAPKRPRAQRSDKKSKSRD